MILVDTSVWIDFLRGANTRERRVLHRLIEDEEDIAVTEIILVEILQGIKEEKQYRRVKDSLLAFPLYSPRGLDTWLKAVELYRTCRKRDKTVRKTVDCLIAAISIENGLTLFHKDSDFENIAACTPLECYKL